ncbi:amidohydrolase family protein [Agromyces sp. CFH 90414]|uniref:Amidohydrolase family protein n=1 Tax=Agromyces agglutinans TaxID=2662258 RepID=A0A6I2FAK9_9MICO|nr:amidohydrolase family protein [Agromyces agglutinans]MRG61401.1 amidohydrolase family protein [Agromyces agglutinans]
MTRVVDAHVHVWDRSRSAYPWITPELGVLDRDVLPDEAGAELAAAGVDAAILVQADDTLDDTRYLLEVASTHSWVAGVVGWAPLDDERAANEALDVLAGERALRGIRHLVHDDPRDDFLDLPAVRASLRAVARAGLAFDVPDAWPRHLAATTRLAEAVPGLTVVLDHLGKPPVGSEAYPAWVAQFRAVAERPNAVAKFSGLHLPGVPFDAATLRPLLDLALEAFGPDRLMYGGDWPMSLPHGGYTATWAVMRTLIDELAPTEREAVLHGTAERVYLDADIRPLEPDVGGESP